VWRYSRIADLDLDAYRPAPAGAPVPGGVPAALQPLLDAVGPRSGLVVVHDGRVVHVELDDGLAAKGVVVGRLAEADADTDGASLGRVAGEPTDALAVLHEAFTAEPVLVRVPRGVVVPHPVLVLQWAEGEGLATFPHLVVEVGEDAELTLLDHQGSADVRALVVPAVELDVAQAGRLRYLGTQQLGRKVWQVGHQHSRIGQDATLLTAMVALGGDYARVRIDSSMVGKGGSSEMLAVYFGEAEQMHDFRTMQDHVAPSTTSDLLFKGAVEGHSRAVYTGLIRVGKGAPGTNAYQTNRNVKLSDGAWAESVPNLEILNNDVKCSHASAVGPVDEEQRFYLESRGVPPQVAERLIVLGFFGEVLERLPVPGAVGVLQREIAEKLDRRDDA
jgi:Fe-S cluster assembly protein SufD